MRQVKKYQADLRKSSTLFCLLFLFSFQWPFSTQKMHRDVVKRKSFEKIRTLRQLFVVVWFEHHKFTKGHPNCFPRSFCTCNSCYLVSIVVGKHVSFFLKKKNACLSWSCYLVPLKCKRIKKHHASGICMHHKVAFCVRWAFWCIFLRSYREKKATCVHYSCFLC